MPGKPHAREHGTIKGYRQHQKPYAANEELCQPCKDARAEHMRKYRKNNPEIMKEAYKRRWARADKELVKEKNKEWRRKNRDHANEYQRNLRRNNPRYLELHNATSRRRRARIKNQGFEFFTETDILNKYGTKCHLCSGEIDLNAPRQAKKNGPLSEGWEKALHIDHVIPIALGGPDTLDNVRPAHAFCNLSKGAKISGNIKLPS
jgi:5-methylcytosine-specific restriction endonuclease McrA